MSDPIVLAEKIDSVVMGFGESKSTCLIAIELLYVKYEQAVRELSKTTQTEESNDDAEVAKMVALAEKNQEKVNDTVNRLTPIINESFKEAGLLGGTQQLVLKELLKRFL